MIKLKRRKKGSTFKVCLVFLWGLIVDKEERRCANRLFSSIRLKKALNLAIV